MGPEEGFNALTDTYENLVRAGVIDPTKVVRTALQNAASIASLMLTTEALVSEIPEKKKAAPVPSASAMYCTRACRPSTQRLNAIHSMFELASRELPDEKSQRQKKQEEDSRAAQEKARLVNKQPSALNAGMPAGVAGRGCGVRRTAPTAFRGSLGRRHKLSLLREPLCRLDGPVPGRLHQGLA